MKSKISDNVQKQLLESEISPQATGKTSFGFPRSKLGNQKRKMSIHTLKKKIRSVAFAKWRQLNTPFQEIGQWFLSKFQFNRKRGIIKLKKESWKEKEILKGNLLLEPKHWQKDNLRTFSIDPCQAVGTPAQIGWRRRFYSMVGSFQASKKRETIKWNNGTFKIKIIQ
jgi:hypothetical protein